MNKHHPIVPVYRERAFTRSFGPNPGVSPWEQPPYGGNNPWAGAMMFGPGPAPFPFQQGSLAGGSNVNWGQLKAIFDRMGGIEGILSTMGKVQKIVQSFQQMSPLLKLLASSFLGSKAKSARERNNPDSQQPVSRPRHRSRKHSSPRARKPGNKARRRHSHRAAN